MLQRSLVAHHPHLWKLREHHLYAPGGGGTEGGGERVWPVAPGNPLRAHIPHGCQLAETAEGVLVREPGRAAPVLYRSWAGVREAGEEEGLRGRLVDVLVTGEVRAPLDGGGMWARSADLGRFV